MEAAKGLEALQEDAATPAALREGAVLPGDAELPAARPDAAVRPDAAILEAPRGDAARRDEETQVLSDGTARPIGVAHGVHLATLADQGPVQPIPIISNGICEISIV